MQKEHLYQTGSKKKTPNTMMKTPPRSRFREIYLPTCSKSVEERFFKASSTDFQKFQIENIASQK